jgi:type VI secretion system protein ImpH
VVAPSSERNQPAPLARKPPSGRGAVGSRPSVETRLLTEGYNFDFFQAVRLLHWLDPRRRQVGRGGPPQAEIVRFRARVSLSFPPSSIYEIRRPTPETSGAVMIQAFMGLTGPNGVLPRHYTELLHRLEREKGPERNALRDWLDLFNHRFVSLFYRAWEKYRFYLPYERGVYARAEADPFTVALLSLVGHGLPPLRHRLIVALRTPGEDPSRAQQRPAARALVRIEDLTLLYYGGLLAHRPRNAAGLEAILGDYFHLPARIRQFQGQWLPLEPPNQTRLAGDSGPDNNQLGVTAVAGERVWDVQTKFRIYLGPLDYESFLEFLPDFAPVPARKTFFLLVHLVRIYAGLELDFDVQLALRADEVPECRLVDDGTVGARLGWNTWVRSLAFEGDADDAVFEGEEVFLIDPREAPSA